MEELKKGSLAIFRVTLALCALVLIGIGAPAVAQNAAAPEPSKVIVDPDGTVHVPAQTVPVSDFLSPEGKAYLAIHLKQLQTPGQTQNPQDNGVPLMLRPYVAREHELYVLDRTDGKTGGVHTYIYVPQAGVSTKNKDRVLIDLHGGGFSGCWPGCAELESMPVSATMEIKVVSVDYREGPEYKFPAASEDVASVYRELLKTYKPENIGIYGCSAGGMLTAMSMAWFQTHGLPSPGAIGIFCASAGGPGGGDSSYTANPLGEARVPGQGPSGAPRMGYFSGVDPNNPLATPIKSPEILAKFPPTLIITGTRAMELSSAVYTHEQLVKLGVDAELHVWEGMFHGFFYNPDVPESREAFDVMIKFFDSHLGKD
jgi:acetyl esterase/lipase